MASLRQVAWSSVGKKVITGVTGLALFGFVIVHLLGNLTLFIGPEAFNGYAYFLEHALHGWLIYAFEVVLIAFFLFHIAAAVTVAWLDKRRARPTGYAMVRDAGGGSRKTLSSRTMIYTGIILLVFVVIHVKMFKFADHPLITRSDGHAMKNLYAVVVDAFNDPLIVAAYVAVMILLGFHLRHGVWSAFQSLGWASERSLPLLTGLALVFAVLLAVGFLILPIYIFLFVDPVSAAAAVTGGH
jgi:succinate dehydrogenase / fumarate reductase cytochrome b subunit